MDPREFLIFVRRRCSAILVAIVILVGLTMGATQGAGIEKGATLFLTMGAQMPEGVAMGSLGASQNENVVDQFTQTVQGWLSTPEFASRVNERLDSPVDLSVRKQEKQNLIVTIRVDSEAIDLQFAEQAGRVVVDVLKEEVQAYDDLTNASYVVARSTITPYTKISDWRLGALIGLMLGLIVGVLVMGFWEYTRRKVSFEFQVHSLVGGGPLIRLNHGMSRSDLEGFVHLYADRVGGVVVLEIGETALSVHRSFLKEHDIEVVRYPEGVKGFDAKMSMVLAVQLGVSSEDHLREVLLLKGDSLPYLLIV